MLYTPPIKCAVFPSKNPFYNGQIVDYCSKSSFGRNKGTRILEYKSNKFEMLNASSKNYKLEKMIKARVDYLQYATGKIL